MSLRVWGVQVSLRVWGGAGECAGLGGGGWGSKPSMYPEPPEEKNPGPLNMLYCSGLLLWGSVPH